MSKKFFQFIKLALAILAFPVLIALTMSFSEELMRIPEMHEVFLCGIIAYVFMHLFVFVPERFFYFVQKIFYDIFQRQPTLYHVVPRVVPFVPTLLLIGLYICASIMNVGGVAQIVMFFVGFAWAMHLVMIAQEMHEEDTKKIKAHYYLLMSGTYVANVLVVALFVDLDFKQFSFLSFLSQWGVGAKELYLSLQGQLFS
ncbi:MAG: hypothetical protein KAJ18_09350 [Candidatus Omnitrophica bacterium]|nr:hypothetical protein [Candidatus Omnitrophota bacterium]